MRHWHTATMLLLTILAFAGTGCGMSRAAANRPASPAAMRAASCHDADSAHHATTASHKRPAEHHRPAPCPTPWSPGCASSAPCASLAIIEIAGQEPSTPLAAGTIASALAAVAESPALAPELPPPRG